MLKTLKVCLLLVGATLYSASVFCAPQIKGIYINQGTLENTAYLKQLIDESKGVGINTFVVDMEKNTKNYGKNIKLIKDNGIRYVARVVVFPDGGKADQIKSQAF